MKVFVIGGGGREHAILWKLKQSPKVSELYCSPGNGGTQQIASFVPGCAENDWNSYADFAESKHIDLTVVGPEAPLTGGIVEPFRKRNLKIFGPDKNSARLEGSKIFAKQFMSRYGIPTAKYQTFSDASKAHDFVRDLNRTPNRLPMVVKADGLAAGKGVSVCQTLDEMNSAIDKMLVQKAFGHAGENILIEEGLIGQELSVMALCDGKTISPLPFARDYKRVFDRNEGPNTGGMGAIAPCAVSDELLKEIRERVLTPFLSGIKKDKMDYRGVIYFGLMLTDQGPLVLEFNVRFGDPETQVVLPLLQTDLFDLLQSVADRKLDQVPLRVADQFCISVVCASGGYPGKFESNKEISGLKSIPENSDSNLFVFHAGTVQDHGKVYTKGGRVLNVVAKGSSFKSAKERCYQGIQKIGFDGMHYRKDIGVTL